MNLTSHKTSYVVVWKEDHNNCLKNTTTPATVICVLVLISNRDTIMLILATVKSRAAETNATVDFRASHDPPSLCVAYQEHNTYCSIYAF